MIPLKTDNIHHQKVRLIIADDHKLFREGIVNLLSDVDDIEIIGQADNGQEAVDKTLNLRPDVIIMDIGMPVVNGIEATEKILREMPDIRILALSMHSDSQYIKGMLKAGAAGYVYKNCNFEELLEAIRTVYSGKKYLNANLTELLIQEYVEKPQAAVTVDPKLTERELEILKLIGEGKQTAEISNLLFISSKTVGTHKQNILEKLNLKSTAELVKYALKNGIASLD